MNNPIETITRDGITASIYQDENTESPNDWGGTDVFLVAFHRDFSVECEGFSKEVCELLGGEYEIYSEELMERVAQIKREYHFFSLEAYIHSCVRLALSSEGDFHDRRWDVSQLGVVFVSKKAARTKAKARTLAHGLIKTWNQYLSGDVYGYVIEDGDSSWGFYGEEAVREAANEAIADAIQARWKAHAAKKRAEIMYKVPLEKRTKLTA